MKDINTQCTVYVYKKTDKLTDDFKASEVKRAISEIKSKDIFKMSKDEYIKMMNDFNRETSAACHQEFHEYKRNHYDMEMKKHLENIESLEKYGFDYVLDLYSDRVYLDDGKDGDFKDRTEFYLIAVNEPFIAVDRPVDCYRTGHRFHATSSENVLDYLYWQGKVNFERIGYVDDEGNFIEGFSNDLVCRIRKFFADNGEKDLLVVIKW